MFTLVFVSNILGTITLCLKCNRAKKYLVYSLQVSRIDTGNFAADTSWYQASVIDAKASKLRGQSIDNSKVSLATLPESLYLKQPFFINK